MIYFNCKNFLKEDFDNAKDLRTRLANRFLSRRRREEQARDRAAFEQVAQRRNRVAACA